MLKEKYLNGWILKKYLFEKIIDDETGGYNIEYFSFILLHKKIKLSFFLKIKKIMKWNKILFLNIFDEWKCIKNFLKKIEKNKMGTIFINP